MVGLATFVGLAHGYKGCVVRVLYQNLPNAVHKKYTNSESQSPVLATPTTKHSVQTRVHAAGIIISHCAAPYRVWHRCVTSRSMGTIHSAFSRPP